MAQANKDVILNVLSREDDVGMHAIGRALGHLFDRQTYDEQVSENTRHNNNRGFSPSDARMGTSMAKFYRGRGYLTPKQLSYWQRQQRTGKSRVGKYWSQLLEEAKIKQAA
tara:strand:+ start:350 stop:682 length:333 start_codon:yes stop_codon:yes gene_type:complete